MRNTTDMMTISEIPGRCELPDLQSCREWIIPSRFGQIQPVVSEALTELGERADLEAVELALHEALTNAIAHGNQESMSKSVRVTLARCSRGAVVLAVKDCGAGFNASLVPDPLGDRLLNDRGRGIFLMRQLVACVDFVYDQGTEVRLWLTMPDGVDAASRIASNPAGTLSESTGINPQITGAEFPVRGLNQIALAESLRPSKPLTAPSTHSFSLWPGLSLAWEGRRTREEIAGSA